MHRFKGNIFCIFRVINLHSITVSKVSFYRGSSRICPSSGQSCRLLTCSLHPSSCGRNSIRLSRWSAAVACKLHFIGLLYRAFLM